MHAFGEQALNWQALRDFARSQARYWPDGRVNAVYPNGDGARDIPDFTELLPGVGLAVLPARRAIGRRWPRCTRSSRASPPTSLRAVDGQTGLVTRLPGGSGDYQYGIVDWPPAMRYGYDVGTAARDTTANALAVERVRTRRRRWPTSLGLSNDATRRGSHQRALADAINAQPASGPTGSTSTGWRPTARRARTRRSRRTRSRSRSASRPRPGSRAVGALRRSPRDRDRARQRALAARSDCTPPGATPTSCAAHRPHATRVGRTSSTPAGRSPGRAGRPTKPRATACRTGGDRARWSRSSRPCSACGHSTRRAAGRRSRLPHPGPGPSR